MEQCIKLLILLTKYSCFFEQTQIQYIYPYVPRREKEAIKYWWENCHGRQILLSKGTPKQYHCIFYLWNPAILISLAKQIRIPVTALTLLSWPATWESQVLRPDISEKPGILFLCRLSMMGISKMSPPLLSTIRIFNEVNIYLKAPTSYKVCAICWIWQSVWYLEMIRPSCFAVQWNNKTVLLSNR